MQIAKYFASLGFDVDVKGVKKVDKALETLEKKLKKFNGLGNSLVFSIGNFSVDQRKLEKTLGNALDVASAKLVFDISKFDIDQSALNHTVAAAMTKAAMTHPLRIAPQILPGAHVPTTVPKNRVREAAVTGAVAGGVGRAGGIPSLFGPAIALGLGGYGLSSLNQRNQQIVSAQLGNTAVVGPENGPESFEWLKRQGNELGFNWLEQAPEFTGFLGSATPLMGYDKSLETYKAFNEFATTRHADPVARKRALKAIQQMAAKGQVNTEELQNQLGDAANFGELPAVFARAYQEFIGGNKSGAEASQALKDAMKKGQVKTGDVLPIVTRMLAEMAAPTLEKSKTSSQSEQGRYQNSLNELATMASNSGVEEGFARIFRTLNAGLSESNGMVRGLAEGFNEATKWADDLLLFPQSFIRALEGRDSVVADWLGVDKTKQLQADWNNIKQIFTDISSIKFDFLPTLEATAKEIASIMNAIAEFQKWKSGSLPTEPTNNSSTEKATFLGMEYASPAAIVGDIINNTGFNLNKARDRGRAVYEDPNSIYYQDAAGYDDQQAEMAKAAAEDKAMGIVNNTNTNEINIEVNVDGSTLAGMDPDQQAHAIGEAVANMFVQSFDQVNVNFPIK